MVELIPDAQMRDLVAHLPGVIAAVHDHADDVGRKAEARLAAHRYAGLAQVTVTQGDVDSFINLIDPAALSIEFGHWVKGKYETETPKYVPGLYILTGAAGSTQSPKQGPRRGR